MPENDIQEPPQARIAVTVYFNDIEEATTALESLFSNLDSADSEPEEFLRDQLNQYRLLVSTMRRIGITTIWTLPKTDESGDRYE